jgi:hypothetical protein
VLNEAVTTDVARVLAELVDTALADDWNEDGPTMALLWEAPDDPDDVRIALRRLEGSIEDELAPLGDLGAYLAVAHSTVTRQPPEDLLPHSDGTACASRSPSTTDPKPASSGTTTVQPNGWARSTSPSSCSSARSSALNPESQGDAMAGSEVATNSAMAVVNCWRLVSQA